MTNLYILIWNLTLVIGSTYLVFARDASGWLLFLAVLFLHTFQMKEE